MSENIKFNKVSPFCCFGGKETECFESIPILVRNYADIRSHIEDAKVNGK